MLYLIGGFAILGGFLLLVYLFVNADPARLARGLKVTGIVIAVLAVATLAISPASGRLSALLIPVAMMMPALVHLRAENTPPFIPTRARIPALLITLFMRAQPTAAPRLPMRPKFPGTSS